MYIAQLISFGWSLTLLGAAYCIPWEGRRGVVFARKENAYNFFINQYFVMILFAKIFYIPLPTYLSKNIMQMCKYACSMQHACVMHNAFWEYIILYNNNQFFASRGLGLHCRPFLRPHSSKPSSRGNFFVFWSFFYLKVFGDQSPKTGFVIAKNGPSCAFRPPLETPG